MTIASDDISIHALREEGDLLLAAILQILPISIHALREEGDRQTQTVAQASSYFYPRPPRGGRRPRLAFLATAGVISIHALREEGDSGCSISCMAGSGISIHALREEGDGCTGMVKTVLSEISIHALREEGDLWGQN